MLGQNHPSACLNLDDPASFKPRRTGTSNTEKSAAIAVNKLRSVVGRNGQKLEAPCLGFNWCVVVFAVLQL